MLDPESAWVDEFKKLKPADVSIDGVMKLADVIEKLTNKVEPNVPGGTVTPGFFKWNKAIFIAQASALTPTPAPDWVSKLASAWAAACTAGIITPGSVSAPSIWTVSSVDVQTLPTAAATIPTISAGQALMVGLLSTVPASMPSTPEKAPETIAKAFRTALTAFTFNLIGISGSPTTPVPLPVVAPAK